MSKEEESHSRNFKGIWIPEEIWLHHDLCPFDRIVWAEINSLESKETGCTASNEYLCKILQCQGKTLQRALANLKARNLVWVEKFDGRKRIMRTCIKSSKTTYDKFDTAGRKKTKLCQDKFDPAAGSNLSPLALGDTYSIENREEEYSSSSLASAEASPAPLVPMPSAPSKPVGITGIRKVEEEIDITPQAREFLRAFQAYNPSLFLTERTVQKEFNLWLKEKTANSLMDIQKAAAFAFSDDFWIARITSLKAFKDNFKTILAQAVNLEKRKDKKQGTQCYLKNKVVVEKIKKHFAKQLKDEIFKIKHGEQVKALLAIMDLQAHSVVNKETGEQLDLNLRDHSEFRQRFGDMFGIDIGSDI